MNIFNTFKRTRVFLWINITGLAIGLAAALLLILFVINELSYDTHFANRDRIVRLLTIYERNGNLSYSAISLRNAYSELPAKTPGIEIATQAFLWNTEISADQKRFQDLRMVLTDAEFLKVFQTKFVEGTLDNYFTSPNAAVITRKQAEIMFGSAANAIDKVIAANDNEYTVTAVVEAFPKNSHLTFDILVPLASFPWLDGAMGLEFLTYYLIREDVSLADTRAAIEDEYRTLLRPWGERVGDPNAHGGTEMLTDIHLKSNAISGGESHEGNMRLVQILAALALFILILAVTNFINLFITQGQMRMNEVGIRKANGAQIGNLVRQFFSEVAWIVFVAFVIGLIIAVLGVPHFARLIGKDVDIMQLLHPAFIGTALVLFVLTVILSAAYPALYLSRFSPLEILGKRVKFSKRRLTASIVVFQSILSIILLSIIVTLYKQTTYLEKLPLGYNPENLMHVITNRELHQNYDAIRQELLKHPEIKDVGGSNHIFGSGWSGQAIANWDEQDKPHPIAEYRLLTGMPELLELELVEGRFWRPDDPDSIRLLLLNEAAVKMLGGESPLEKTYKYYGPAQVTGVVKDFCFSHPMVGIEPIALSRVFSPQVINIRFTQGVDPLRAQEIALAVFRQFDSEFILNPLWSTEIYAQKFDEIKTIMRMVVTGSLIAMFVAMLGLLAIHLFTAQRRTKEIGIRRIHGADRTSIFILLSFNVLKWIGYAALLAIPLSIFLINKLLQDYPNHESPDAAVFLLPVIAQCLIALLTTSGVSLSVLSKDPVLALKTE